jgi:hypothetical protein
MREDGSGHVDKLPFVCGLLLAVSVKWNIVFCDDACVKVKDGSNGSISSLQATTATLYAKRIILANLIFTA